MEEEEVKEGRFVVCSAPVVPEPMLMGVVVGVVESPEYATEEEEVKEGRFVVWSAPVVPEGSLVGSVVRIAESL